jgi:hypothetical protein
MEQKEIAQKIMVNGVTTLEKLLVFLSMLSQDAIIEWLHKKLPLEGEADISQFLRYYSDYEKIPLDSKVNLEQFKEAFKEFNITFAFQEVENGTELYIRSQDRKTAAIAVEKIFKDIVTKKVDINKYVLKKGSYTFKEKVALTYKQLEQNTMKEKRFAPSESKTKGR